MKHINIKIFQSYSYVSLLYAVVIQRNKSADLQQIKLNLELAKAIS